MSDELVRGLTWATALGSALIAGVFFAFSTFVMRGLRALPPAEGISAMQAINLAAPKGAFVAVLMLTALPALGLVVAAGLRWDASGAGLRLAGGLAYLATVALTAGYHVPRNDALAKLDPHAPGAARAWATYAADWTTWNHLRTALPFLGLIVLVLALTSD